MQERKEEAISQIAELKDNEIGTLKEEVRRLKKELAFARKQSERA